VTPKEFLFQVKYRCYRRQAFGFYAALRNSQFWSADQWIDYQIKKRKELVLTAFLTTPFYGKFYGDVGFQIEDVDQKDFFEKLPVLTKQHVRDFYNELINPKLESFLAVSSTGGSTGIPTRFGYDRRYPAESLSWRMMEWWKIAPWDDGAYVWRNRRSKFHKRLFNEMLWWPTRKIRLDASSMDLSNMAAFIDALNTIQPPLLQGYVGAIAELAQFVVETGCLSHHPKAVWLTSAPIVSVQRRQIENTFCAPVYDQYGCCEAPNIAAQCGKQMGLHVNAESLSLEFVDEANNPVPAGEWGKALISKFDDFVFPLIRYEVGDVGRYLAEPCPCGRSLPVIDRVKGRTTDIIRLPSGRVLSGEYLTTIFDSCPDAVNGFRVTQRKDLSLLIEYIPVGDIAREQAVQAVKAQLEADVGYEVPVNFVKVVSLAHDRGKQRFVVKEI